MLRLALCSLLVLSACITRVEKAPTTPVARTVEPGRPPDGPLPQKTLIERFTSLTPMLGTCEQWGTDSVLCHQTPTSALWCVAHVDDVPHCEKVLDWTPEQPKEQLPTVPTPPGEPGHDKPGVVSRKAPPKK